MSITTVKDRLVHVPEKSLRYRVASYLWHPSRISTAKACTFYWVMMPTSAIGIMATGCAALVVGPCAAAMVAAISVVAWFVGKCPFYIKDVKTGKNIPGRLAYPYKYSPRKGRRHRFAPWQIALIPAVSLLGVWLVRFRPHIPAISWVSNHPQEAALWCAAGLAGLAVLYGIGKLTGFLLSWLMGFWSAVCPPLVVVNSPKPE